MINHLSSHLSARGLSTAISLSDEFHYDHALKMLRTIDGSALSSVARIRVHGYQHADGDRAGLRDAAAWAGKPLWNNEYGDGVESEEGFARYFLKDIRELRLTA